MNKKWLVAAGSGTLLLMSAAGIGIGHASTAPVNTGPPAITQPAQTQAVDNEVKATVDKDNLQVQQGSQIQDAQGTETTDGAEAKTQARESDAGGNLPGGGHADQSGPNVNNDFYGVQ